MLALGERISSERRCVLFVTDVRGVEGCGGGGAGWYIAHDKFQKPQNMSVRNPAIFWPSFVLETSCGEEA
jgi:hypothetical protein